jgi:hypothetical protein
VECGDRECIRDEGNQQHLAVNRDRQYGSKEEDGYKSGE